MLSLRSRNNAFSLLEVIVSVAILSGGIVVVLQAFSFATGMAGFSKDMINAVFIAEDIMQELEYKELRGDISKEPLEAKGQIDKFNWEYSMNAEPDSDLYKLDLHLKWLRANREEELDLKTFLKK